MLSLVYFLVGLLAAFLGVLIVLGASGLTAVLGGMMVVVGAILLAAAGIMESIDSFKRWVQREVERERGDQS